LVGFLFARVDQLPILSGLQGHLAEEGVFAFEISSDYLPEEEDLGDEIGFGFEVVEMMERG
jgi:hypothetical protein